MDGAMWGYNPIRQSLKSSSSDKFSTLKIHHVASSLSSTCLRESRSLKGNIREIQRRLMAIPNDTKSSSRKVSVPEFPPKPPPRLNRHLYHHTPDHFKPL